MKLFGKHEKSRMDEERFRPTNTASGQRSEFDTREEAERIGRSIVRWDFSTRRDRALQPPPPEMGEGRDVREVKDLDRGPTPRAEPRTGRRERIVLGTYLLACYMAVISMLVGETFTTASRSVTPNPASAGQILVVAAMTLASAVALAFRFFGFAGGAKMILIEAWPGFLAGGALGLITGAPLRAAVSDDDFWLVLAPIYATGVLLISWFARRAPSERERLE